MCLIWPRPSIRSPAPVVMKFSILVDPSLVIIATYTVLCLSDLSEWLRWPKNVMWTKYSNKKAQRIWLFDFFTVKSFIKQWFVPCTYVHVMRVKQWSLLKQCYSTSDPLHCSVEKNLSLPIPTGCGSVSASYTQTECGWANCRYRSWCSRILYQLVAARICNKYFNITGSSMYTIFILSAHVAHYYRRSLATLLYRGRG